MFDSAAARVSERARLGSVSAEPAGSMGFGGRVVRLPFGGSDGPVSGPVAGPVTGPSAGPADCHPMELCLLGGFRLVVGGEFVHVGRTGERVLAAVACRGRQVSRAQVASALWPDVTSARAHANLRTALYRLSRVCPVVHASSSHVQLAVGLSIDVERASRVAARVVAGEGGSDVGVVAEALGVNLYEDLLPDWDDEWLVDQQYRYRQLRLTALEMLSGLLTRAGQFGAAVQAALAAVQADGLRDSAHETLIRACLAQGNRHEAFLHFQSYRRLLRDELGLDPPARLSELLFSA